MFYRTLLTSLVAISASLQSVTAHPDHGHGEDSFHELSNFQVRQSDASLPFSAAKFPEVQRVLQGNAQFRQQRNAAKLQALVENGQAPPFSLISCSDSRLPEATIFNSEPGTFFVERNIANQYKPGDENAQSVINYGIRVLGSRHIVVLGHYGCGGVAAAIATPPQGNIDASGHIIQSWVGDVRQLYLSSNRSEIVEMRNANQAREARGELVEEPDRREAGFRALVEENVKQQVTRLATSSLIINVNAEIRTTLNVDCSRRTAGGEGRVENVAAEGAAEGGRASETRAAEGAAETGALGVPPEGGKAGEETPLVPVFIHGWVHDIETGEVIDLNISVGPSGFENFVGCPGENNQAPAEGGQQPAEGNNGGEQPAEGNNGGERPAEGNNGGEAAPSEGAGETPAAEGGEQPAETGAAEGGSSESGSAEGATTNTGDITVVGVHFQASVGAAVSGGAVPVRRSTEYQGRTQSRRRSRIEARHDAEEEAHDHKRRHDSEDEAHDHKRSEEHQARHDAEDEAHDHQRRQYPPPARMYRRRRSLSSSS